jgi:hypothetical protein
MMIAYTGLDGSGKTYHMAEVCQRVLRAGIDCFGTTPFQGARMLENHRQLLRINKAHIFFDEWHQDNDAREWYHLDPVLKHIISQHRHYDLVIHWSAQAWAFMDPFVRRETAFVWDHEALFRDKDTGRSKIAGKLPFVGTVAGLHKAVKYPAWEIELKHRRPKVLASRYFFIRPAVYETYDSYKKIALTSKKVSDDEISAIVNPYNAKIILDVRGLAIVKHKRMIPASLVTTATTPNPVEHRHADLISEQGSLDDDEEAEDRIKLSERQEEAEDTRAGVEVSNPIEQGGR